jgi:hypothetical protein
MFAVEFSHATIIDISQRYTLCLGSQPIAKAVQELAERLLAGPAHFTPARPIDLEGQLGLSHGRLLWKINQRGFIIVAIGSFVNVIILDARNTSMFALWMIDQAEM